jgi:hypothetical protein
MPYRKYLATLGIHSDLVHSLPMLKWDFMQQMEQLVLDDLTKQNDRFDIAFIKRQLTGCRLDRYDE